MSSPRLKLFVKRVFVGAVGSTLRAASWPGNFGKRVVRFAEKHGLERRHSQIDHIIQPGFEISDFLFLMRRIEGAPGQIAPESPLCSIIVLAYNKAEYTFQCLRSLFRECDLRNTEVIVVNNASSDNTAEMLSYFGDSISVVNNDENLGFVGGCNSGAQVAKGKHLLFVNNDTVVLPGWLDSLLKTVEDRDDVGAVGSLFLYPDGTVQEAGSIVWRDANAHHYGWGSARDDHRFNFAREVDYCSGASLLIRRDLFEKLGGFDGRYAPGYYEDVDLCFGVRSLGYKVTFQPMSQIVHFEGITSGLDYDSGMRRFQEINRVKFYQKWQDVLEKENFEKDQNNLLAASNRKRSPIVLVFDDRIPTPDRDAGSARMLAILKILANRSRVIFVPLNSPTTNHYLRLLWAEGIETDSITNYRKLFASGADTAIFSRPWVADLLLRKAKAVSPKTQLVYDMVDAHFVRLQRELDVSGDATVKASLGKLRKIEMRAARKADVLWCNSREDLHSMERVLPGIRGVVVPTIHELKPPGKPFSGRKGLLFVGNMKHTPNADAVHWLVTEILPAIHQELPEVRLTIVGEGATPEIKALARDSVSILGYVPDVTPLFESSRVFLAPLRFGAGTKGKIGEALSYGLPLVTTSVGAESMGLVSGENAMIEDDPVAFARSVTTLYRDADAWQRIAREGRRHIANNYVPEIIETIINKSIKGLDPTN